MNSYIVDFRTDAQRGIGRKSPRRSGPRDKIDRQILTLVEHLTLFILYDLELHCRRSVANFLVAPRLIQLMRTKSGAIRRRVRLYGIALVEQSFLINIFQKIPQGLDVTIVVSDVRVVHIHPVAHSLGHVLPFGGVFHHLFAAGAVIVLDGNLSPDVVLMYSELLLDANLHRQAMSVPPSAAINLEACLRLIPTNSILYGTGHHMVNARLSIGGRRPLKKNELWGPISQLERFLECVIFLPTFQNFISCRDQIKAFVLFECHD